jgi:glycopeptide antibiotics resistance protein
VKITEPLSEPKETLFLILATAWTVFIAILCLMNSKSLPNIGIGFNGFDKVVHVFLHFVFATLWSGYIRTKGKYRNKQAFQVVLASLLYGILIEIAQAFFTTSRKADIIDVGANTLGAVLAIVLLLSVQKRIKN